jgi:uncharacterized membrane protein YheB (UPF0754 family)
MSVFNIIAPPLIGGIIGYVTNDLAIKMLFRPYKPIYVGSVKLPFTPGIVPKRLQTLAVLLGREVEAQFFNADDLEILFKSDGFSETVAASITSMIYSRKQSLCLVMEELESDPRTGEIIGSAKDKLCDKIVEAMVDFDYTPVIRSASDQIGSDRRTDGLPRGSAKNTINLLAPSISDGIRDYMRRKGKETIAPIVETMLVDFGDRPMKSIAAELLPDEELTKQLIKELYQSFMAVYVRPIVESIDVGGMITEKLRLMEPKAVETLILSVVNREFRYVVWLGGVLGAVIGMVNIFI